MNRVLLVGLLVGLVACSARSPVAKVQIAALTVGESVLAINQAERTIRLANLPAYTKADQDTVGAGILKALYAARAFERAAVAAPTSGTSEAIETAKQGLDLALKDLAAALPAVGQVRTPLLVAITAAQAALAAWRAQ